MIDVSLIPSALPKNVLNFIQDMNGAGWCLTLIGGSVRDFLLSQFNSSIHFECHDFDFEIRSFDLKTMPDLEKWLAANNEKYPFFKQNFGVWTLDTNGISIEISIPRIEKYTGTGPFKHSDFECILDLGLDYKTSFLRRDFTINSMGIEFKNGVVTFIDPYLGLDSLQNKILKTVNPDFVNDPVRYLRAFRFAHNLNFKFDDVLLGKVNVMSLKYLSSYYFFKELFKVKDSFSFCQSIVQRKFLNDDLLYKLNKIQSIGTNQRIENKIEFAFLYLFEDHADDFLKKLNVYSQRDISDIKKIISFIKNYPAIDRPISDIDQLKVILQNFKIIIKYKNELKNQKIFLQKNFTLALEFEKYQIDASILESLDNSARSVFKLSSFLKEYYEHQHHQKS